MRRKLALFLAAAATIAGSFALAGPASAHVTVHSTDAAAGGYGVLTFRVPTESDTASTTKLLVRFPADTPIASVLVQPHPGWTFTTTTAKLSKPVTTDDGDTLTTAVSQIVWTADSAATAIKPGEFDVFAISAGPLPNVKTLAFSAIQTYSDGSVVKWDETAAPGSDVEPQHPKPSITLATSAASTKATSKSGGGGGDTDALVLAIIALVLGAGALGLSVVNRAKAASR
ncbi:MAG TPA: YcnI family protein [Jatrophihabitantaceae bacterium]|nr:YcnI family protein [Jatrophihabitantaceae bacterium]